MARTGKVVHSVLHGVLFALSSVFTGFTLAFVFDLAGYYVRKGGADDGDMLGIGISIALLTVFVVIGAIATSLSSAISLALSAFLVKKSEGGRKIWGVVSLILSAVYLATSLSSLLYAIMAAK